MTDYTDALAECRAAAVALGKLLTDSVLPRLAAEKCATSHHRLPLILAEADALNTRHDLAELVLALDRLLAREAAAGAAEAGR